MTDTDDRAVLEERVRTALSRRAVTMFADDVAPVDLPAQVPNRGRSQLLAVAVLLAALVALAAVAVAAIRRPANGERAASSQPSSSSTVQRHYPEAAGLTGVRVAPAVPLTGGVQVEVGAELAGSRSGTLPLGDDTVFLAHVTYGTGTAGDAGALVVTVLARGARVSCPPDFLIRPLHTYDIDCTLLPDAETGSVEISVGHPNAGDRVHVLVTRFSAAWLSGLGEPSPGEHALARAEGSGDVRVDVGQSTGRGTMYAACIGGGTITVTMVGRGAVDVPCSGTAAGASLPRLGSTVRVSAPRGQRWRLAVFGR